MSSRISRTTWVTGLVAAAAVTGLVGPAPATAATGPSGTDAHAFTARIVIGDGDPVRACSAALVSREWVVTTASCFADDTTSVTAGKPKTKATVSLRGAVANGTAYTGDVAELVPARDRDVVMARLSAYAPENARTVSLAGTPLAVGDEAVFAGTGRTRTEWVPDEVHTAALKVDGTSDTDLSVSGKSADDAVCQGDIGGPLLRETGSGLELVGLATRSWKGGCLGTPDTETRTDARAARTDDLGEWISATANRAWTRQIAAGDFTGDDKADVVAIDKTDGKLYAHPGDGKGSFTGRNQIGVQWETTRAITAGNFVGDKNADLVAIRDNGMLFTYPGNGKGVSNAPIQAGNGWDNMRLLASADFTGDGKIDLLAAHTNGKLYVYPGTGDGKFGSGVGIGDGWTGIRLIAGGDFNGDRKADVIAINNNGTMYRYDNNGKGGLGSAVKVGDGWKSTRLLSSADFNGDGKADFLALRSAGTFLTYAGNGTGSFAKPIITQP
ncbi:FG-GAP-like repeat-containing protein [Streptomyces sp. NPDC001941]|uniref:FG-GAP-like repeat-containing protein n=1 Tax=Streptomyces sp. NPDC001941 TaxID=3154659 RepID=UPI003331906C